MLKTVSSIGGVSSAGLLIAGLLFPAHAVAQGQGDLQPWETPAPIEGEPQSQPPPAQIVPGEAGVEPPGFALERDEPVPLTGRPTYALQLGGGVTNFIGDGAQDLTDFGGTWDVRVAIGTRQIVGLEVAYVGAAFDVDGASDDAYLLGNGAELLLRLNAPIERGGGGLVEPYLLGGVGWTDWTVANDDTDALGLGRDSVMTLPLGAGVATVLAGYVIDARFMYRPAFDEDLFGAGVDLGRWSVTAHVGREF